MTAIVISLLAGYGFIHRLVPIDEYGSNAFERSLEYRNDLKMYQRLGAFIDDGYSDYAIGCSLRIGYVLNFWELGYVGKKLDVLIYGNRPTHEGMRNFDDIRNLDRKKIVWAAFTDYGTKDANKDLEDYPIGPQDIILKTLYAGKRNVTVFMGGYSIEKMRLFVEFERRRLGLN